MLFLQMVVSKPLCPTLIHDDTTRLVVCVVGIVVGVYLLYRIMRGFNSI